MDRVTARPISRRELLGLAAILAVAAVLRMAWPESPEPPLIMRTGVYVYPQIQNVPVLDVAGNLASDAVEIPLR